MNVNEFGTINSVKVPSEIFSQKNVQGKKVDLSDPVDVLDLSSKAKAEVKETEKKPSTAKKVLVGTASAFIPGLGQAINGEPKKGLKYFAKNILISGGSGLVSAALIPICLPAAIAVGLAGSGLGIANVIGSIKDAIKNV